MMDEKNIVEYVARLARVAVDDSEKQYLDGQLSRILDYVGKLNELNLEGVKPLRGFHPASNIFKSDEVKPSSARDGILNNAPAREGDYFKIPRVID